MKFIYSILLSLVFSAYAYCSDFKPNLSSSSGSVTAVTAAPVLSGNSTGQSSGATTIRTDAPMRQRPGSEGSTTNTTRAASPVKRHPDLDPVDSAATRLFLQFDSCNSLPSADNTEAQTKLLANAMQLVRFAATCKGISLNNERLIEEEELYRNLKETDKLVATRLQKLNSSLLAQRSFRTSLTNLVNLDVITLGMPNT